MLKIKLGEHERSLFPVVLPACRLRSTVTSHGICESENMQIENEIFHVVQNHMILPQVTENQGENSTTTRDSTNLLINTKSIMNLPPEFKNLFSLTFTGG